MCGIVGYLGKKPVVPLLLESLKLLEYRGYDSSGVATLGADQDLTVYKASGKLENLQKILPEALNGKKSAAKSAGKLAMGIGHIRWATHGAPTDRNAHPHLSHDAEVAVVHNGIIENDQEIRSALSNDGIVFASDTDSECVAQLLAQKIKGVKKADDLLETVREAVGHLRGAYALALMFKKFPDRMIAVRQHAPLVIGVSEQGEYLISSDAVAIAHITQRIIFLKDREIAEITPKGVRIITTSGDPVSPVIEDIQQGPLFIDKKGYKHFMLKEIYEQPDVVRLALSGRLVSAETPVKLFEKKTQAEAFAQMLEKAERLVFVGCGSSYHASLVGKYFIEALTGLPVSVDSAGEFRYRPSFSKSPKLITAKTLVIGLSQSGETADTLEALRQARAMGAPTLVVTNREDATMAREADFVMPVRAGVEVSVCATKSFTAQVVALYLLGLAIAEGRPKTSAPKAMLDELKQAFFKVPSLMESILSDPSGMQAIAKHYLNQQNMIFMGRTLNYPVAMEGALKLKEVSYLHAEGYSGSELKHGPIAMLDATMPVVAILTPGPTFDKMISNCQEVRARDTDVISVIGVPYAVFEGSAQLPPEQAGLIARVFNHVVYFPETHELLSPLLTSIPLQFLAYYMAMLLGKDVDQPRNLAKSVTVE